MSRIIAAIAVTAAIILTAQVRLAATQAPSQPPWAVTKVAATAASRLIPFQGHLTRPRPGDDKVYEAVPDGRYDVLFTLYTAPVGGESRVWGPERHEKLVVVNGLVNALIGSVDKGLEALKPEQLSGPLYVGVTIDADGKPETPDLELVPRQVMLPAMYAHEAGRANFANTSMQSENSEKLGGVPFTSILTATEPTLSSVRQVRDSQLFDGHKWIEVETLNGILKDHLSTLQDHLSKLQDHGRRILSIENDIKNLKDFKIDIELVKIPMRVANLEAKTTTISSDGKTTVINMGKLVFKFQSDGNAVIYDEDGHVHWASDTPR